MLDKFRDEIDGFGWMIDNFESLIENCRKLYESEDLAKANYLINSITICDPAVGSGRFLIACLNELLYIKFIPCSK